MTDKRALPGGQEPPKGGNGPDALWPEGSPAHRHDDVLQAPELFDGIMVRRVVAYVLDGIAVGLLWILAWLILAALTTITFGLTSPLMVILFLLPLIYHSLSIAYLGATPGMCLLDVEVRLLNGQRPDLPHAILFTILFFATTWMTAFLVLLVALFNRRGRCLHDILTGLLLVRRSALSPA
ncbi:MAG TPA: RDD family protein [Kiloniellaceae bacterium]|nr:RDD family protein [Kiloniellaceae bacterium]